MVRGFNIGNRSPAWLHADLLADVIGVGVDTDIAIDEIHSQAGSDISLNVSTGVFSLTPGRAYAFEAKFYTRNYSLAAGDAGYEWVFNDNSEIVGAKRAICRPVTHTSQHSQNPTAMGILKVTAPTDIKIRCVAASGTHDLIDLGTNVFIMEII